MIDDFQDRHHAFEGCFNFRDIGGYPAMEGQRVRWGIYYRAGRQDRMTSEDLSKLAGLGIRAQVDLRQPSEVQAQGQGPLPEMGASYHHLPIIPEGGSDQLTQLVGDSRISGQRYLGYLQVGSEKLLRLFHLLAAGENLPLVVHCTAGKDRTGVATAFLLSVLGVDRALIEADYRLTNLDVARLVDFVDANEGLPDGMDRDGMAVVAGVPEEAIGDFLDGLDTNWGGPVNYLRHLGVTEDMLSAVRSAFLE